MTYLRYLACFACACNPVFGLTATTSTGAPYYDAPADAPFACPALGAGSPTYSDLLGQVFLQDCSEYSPSAASGRAVATCNEPNGNNYICEGPLGQMLSYALASPAVFPRPRLSSDGNTLYAIGGPSPSILAFTRDSGTWTAAPNAGFAPSDPRAISTVMRGVGGDHLIVTHGGLSMQLDEWGNEGGSWHITSVHPWSELGLTNVSQVSLTTDGLHALVLDLAGVEGHTFYTDRPSLDAPFRPATPIAGFFRGADDATLSDDCSRVYFSGLGSVFYVQQQ